MKLQRLLKKLLIWLTVLSLLFILFLRSVRQTESEPYLIEPQFLSGWTLHLEQRYGPEGPLLSLSPPREMTMALFQQIFERTMESLNAPRRYGITLILRSEYEKFLASTFEPSELLMLAQKSSLEQATLTPTCLAERTAMDTTSPRRTFFVLFALQEFNVFRQSITQQIPESLKTDPSFTGAIPAPILFMAATDGGFQRWPAPHPSPEEDCVAPVTTLTQ